MIHKLPGVVYSHFETQRIVGEQFIAEHGLCYVISGTMKVTDMDKSFGAGEVLFYRKNFLAKFVKQPEEHREFRSITVVLDQQSLQSFSQQYNITAEEPFRRDKEAVLKLSSDILLENYFKTLLPYFDQTLPETLVSLKRQEAIMLLLKVGPQLKNLLFDFDQPGKIDLEAFMQQNFRYNVEMQRLAYLTGRSLATFKRDFRKIFQTSPLRWLQQRRLEEAHHLMTNENRRPSDVYHEVGFESLSHFSYSFKKRYGFNPSDIKN